MAGTVLAVANYHVVLEFIGVLGLLLSTAKWYSQFDSPLVRRVWGCCPQAIGLLRGEGCFLLNHVVHPKRLLIIRRELLVIYLRPP